MKNMKLIIAQIMLAGVTFVSAQTTDAIRPNRSQQMQEIADFAEASAENKEQGDRIAAAADYLKMALVLGLGMLIGRMSAVSCRELKELKANVARLANSNGR